MGARDVKIAANHLPTYLCWKHPNILTDPLPLSQFLHLLPTPLWIMGLLSAFPDRFCLFQSGLDLLDNWPILWITEPSTGPHSYIAVSPFCGLGVPNENKRFVRAMVVLTPWHWLVDCISPFYPLYPSPLNHFIWWHLHLVACSWHQDKLKQKIYIFSRILLLFCSNRYKEMSVTHIQCWFLTCVATYRLFWCSQCAYVADYPGLHIATNQMCWTSWYPRTQYPEPRTQNPEPRTQMCWTHLTTSQGSLLFPKIEFFIKGDICGWSFL